MNPFADPLFVQAEVAYRRERALWTMRHLSEPGTGRRRVRRLVGRLGQLAPRGRAARPEAAVLGCRSAGPRPAA